MGIGGILQNSDDIVVAMFSKYAGNMESSEAVVLAILEAPHTFLLPFRAKLIVDNDSRYAIAWTSSMTSPWKLQFLTNNIIPSSPLIDVMFTNGEHPANCFAEFLAKQGVIRSSPLLFFFLFF